MHLVCASTPLVLNWKDIGKEMTLFLKDVQVLIAFAVMCLSGIHYNSQVCAPLKGGHYDFYLPRLHNNVASSLFSIKHRV